VAVSGKESAQHETTTIHDCGLTTHLHIVNQIKIYFIWLVMNRTSIGCTMQESRTKTVLNGECFKGHAGE